MAGATAETVISQSFLQVMCMPADEFLKAKSEMCSKTGLRMSGYAGWKITESMKNSANAPSAN